MLNDIRRPTVRKKTTVGYFEVMYDKFNVDEGSI
jgi:hypothetical protein